MKRQLLYGICICLFSSCSNSETNNLIEPKDYQVVLEDDIYVEKFDSTNVNENRYTDNNQSFKEGNIYTYDYYYEDKEGMKFKFQDNEGSSELPYSEREKAWHFVSLDSLNEETINKVNLRVKFGLQPMINSVPDYNQTVICFKYKTIKGDAGFSSCTGVIENEKNIWAHPPRDKFFRILELNPFPFIQHPYEIGNTWEWSLKIGSSWGDERWMVWDGGIENKYVYKITGLKNIETPLGSHECYEVKSTATSSIGSTALTAYWNLEIGIIKLDYTNIDGTKTVLTLNDFQKVNKE